jgi:type 1 glutamine amidotransferase
VVVFRLASLLLLTFLLGPQNGPEKEGRKPPRRSRAEVEAVLGAGPAATPEKPRAVEAVLVSSAEDHGAGEHDYPAWQRSWAKLLAAAPEMQVRTATGWPSREDWERARLVVFYFWNHDWSEARYRELDAFLDRGGGLVVLHAAVIADQDPESLARRLGLAAQPVRTGYRHGPLELKFPRRPENPITRGFPTLRLLDETYWPLIGDPAKVEVLATALEEDQERPMLWTFRRGAGRVFASVLGHYTWTLDDPLFRLLVLRGMAWAAGEPPGRWEPLVLSGL